MLHAVPAAGQCRRYRHVPADNKLSIVDGPSAAGLYRVRVAPTKLAQADLMRVVKTLQDNKVVGFIADRVTRRRHIGS